MHVSLLHRSFLFTFVSRVHAFLFLQALSPSLNSSSLSLYSVLFVFHRLCDKVATFLSLSVNPLYYYQTIHLSSSLIYSSCAFIKPTLLIFCKQTTLPLPSYNSSCSSSSETITLFRSSEYICMFWFPHTRYYLLLRENSVHPLNLWTHYFIYHFLEDIPLIHFWIANWFRTIDFFFILNRKV